MFLRRPAINFFMDGISIFLHRTIYWMTGFFRYFRDFVMQ
jgi:hypothetical protein